MKGSAPVIAFNDGEKFPSSKHWKWSWKSLTARLVSRLGRASQGVQHVFWRGWPARLPCLITTVVTLISMDLGLPCVFHYILSCRFSVRVVTPTVFPPKCWCPLWTVSRSLFTPCGFAPVLSVIPQNWLCGVGGLEHFFSVSLDDRGRWRRVMWDARYEVERVVKGWLGEAPLPITPGPFSRVEGLPHNTRLAGLPSHGRCTHLGSCP